MVNSKALKEEWARLIYYPSHNYTQQWQAGILESWRSARRKLQRRRVEGEVAEPKSHETAFPLLRGCRQHKIASSTQSKPASLGQRKFLNNFLCLVAFGKMKEIKVLRFRVLASISSQLVIWNRY
ncbi:hypothetical protein CDAR_15031 [Caerostris darwini]|uniref:Uncharacterized protein n=1 Tax=Caerostris darwini TaxID=1538125 RepID=A0AAV4PAZ3_9ARAC|nr:hypothetical protein CDAR_15031 [Caerostris darwini]